MSGLRQAAAGEAPVMRRRQSGGSSVKARLTPKTRPPSRSGSMEATDYDVLLRRLNTAFGRHVAGGDIEGLALLAGLTDHLEQVVREAVAALRHDHGYSWSEVGRTLGTTRQAAQQRWGS